jgi:hypothetical protein
MIRYAITPAELEAMIEQAVPGWLTDAQNKTKHFVAIGKYEEATGESIWGKVKSVFIEFQFDKCAYCERELGGRDNSGEYDVEHYRPKSSVKMWPTRSIRRKRKLANYDFPTGEESAQGYYRLAYNVRNYAATCKRCNSSLKSNYFPVAKPRVFNSDDYDVLRGEEPYLLFPVGNIDQDEPEEVVTFFGFLPLPTDTHGRKYQRGRITIDFFDLTMREELIRARANIIVAMWLNHQILKSPGVSEELKARAQSEIDNAIKDESPHANCARAYNLLCQKDPESARKWRDLAEPHRVKAQRKERFAKLSQIREHFYQASSIRSILGF